MFGGLHNPLWGTECLWYLYNYGVVLLFAVILAFPVYPWLKKRLETWGRGGKLCVSVVGTAGYLGLFLLTTAYLVNDTYNPFLYFRF